MEIDAAQGIVRRNIGGTCFLGDDVRSMELLLLIANMDQGDGVLVAELSRRAVGAPTPKLTQHHLATMKARNLVERSGSRWRLALVEDENVHVAPDGVDRELLRVQALLAGDRRVNRRPSKRQIIEAGIAASERQLASGHPAASVRTLDVVGTASSIQRTLSRSARDEVLARALGTRGIALMNCGATAEALHYLGLARRHADLWDPKGPWLVHLLNAEAATHRMNAALYPEQARQHLLDAVAAFERGLSRIGELHCDAEERDRLHRWMVAERITPHVLLATARHAEGGSSEQFASDLERARRYLDEAIDLVARRPMSVADRASTFLLGVRALSKLDQRAAEVSLTAAKQALQARGAPDWVIGWQPRFELDLYWRGLNDDEQRATLVACWRTNTAFGFQQLHALARFALLGVEPDQSGLDQDEVTHIELTIRKWHYQLRGKAVARCCGRPGTLLPPIRCMLRVTEGAELGLWR